MNETLEKSQLWHQSPRVTVEDFSLVVSEGPHQGLSVDLDKDLFYLGRSEVCDVALPHDRRVSGMHCELRLSKEGVRVRDLGSRNGCIVAGHRILDGYLSDGSSLQIGDTVCILRSNKRKAEISVPCVDTSGRLVGQSPQMRRIFALLSRLANKDLPLLLTGETGTGKSSLAQVLHEQSSRRNGPFVTVNCGALPASLIESELFGYEKGAFTGAEQQHPGYFEQANGGTLFLDEIGEIPLELQPKLLDVVERKRIRRLGGKQEFPVDCRLVTATHRQLIGKDASVRFRSDLFYRLAVVQLEVPPLRERLEDLSLLVAFLLPLIAPGKQIEMTPDALRKLQGYLWPGNVRELRNVLERSLLWLDGPILDADSFVFSHDFSTRPEVDLSSENHLNAAASIKSPQSPALDTIKVRLAEAERKILVETLEALQWNVSKAAQTLEVSRTWLYGRMKSYNIQRPDGT